MGQFGVVAANLRLRDHHVVRQLADKLAATSGNMMIAQE
jgi:hypothetical protein